MNWFAERKERKRLEKLARKWAYLRSRAKARIQRRLGQEFICRLLKRGEMESNTNYTVSQPRSYWRNGAERAIWFALDRDWCGLDPMSIEALITETLEFVFTRAGADWNHPAGQLGIGLNVSAWERIGIEARKMVKDRALTLKLAQ